MHTPYAPLLETTLDENIESHSRLIAANLQTAQKAQAELDERKPQTILDAESDVEDLKEQLRAAQSKAKKYTEEWKRTPRIRELHESLDRAQKEIDIDSKTVGLLLTEKRLRYHLQNIDFGESHVPLGMIELDGKTYHIQANQIANAGWYCSSFEQAKSLWDYAIEKDILNMLTFEVNVEANREVTSEKNMNAMILELIKSPSPPPVTFKPQVFRRENASDLSPFYLRETE